MTKSGWMNDLHQALTTHSLADLLDFVRVDLKEVDEGLVRVTVHMAPDDQPSATRMISKYKIRGFKENTMETADRIWSRVELNVRRVRETTERC